MLDYEPFLPHHSLYYPQRHLLDYRSQGLVRFPRRLNLRCRLLRSLRDHRHILPQLEQLPPELLNQNCR